MKPDDRIATSDGTRRSVRTLFATIADRCDPFTVLLSCALDRRSKERLVAIAEIHHVV